MIPDAEWSRLDERTKKEVRYPAWYPWFLRGDEANFDGGGGAGTCDHYPIDLPTRHGRPARSTSPGALGSG